ncbi:hypothetical protein SVIO_024050 [Streptomyces violaceusniger]|uniref:ABC transporter ATP-binding protein n=1 Tax=Streptomyces violaceusniger TaxID=68280 RepID=A0A4D4KSX8_STRVO|nr:hypothetical protein SVIO_024050 [Streptomyces violaceusniger]
MRWQPVQQRRQECPIARPEPDLLLAELVREAGGDTVKVATRGPARSRDVLAGPGVDITGQVGSEELHVTGLTTREIGLKAAEHGIPLFELSRRTVSLEAAFMDLTRDAKEALNLIGDTGRQDLGELRRVLGVLREVADSPSSEPLLSPQPDIVDIDMLCAGVRTSPGS